MRKKNLKKNYDLLTLRKDITFTQIYQFIHRGYISQELFRELLEQGIFMVTRVKKNMKNKLMSSIDKVLLLKRALIESVFSKIKLLRKFEHTRRVYVKPEIRKHQTDKGGVLILDDSIEEKPHTDENEIVAWAHSNAKGRHVKGINILSCFGFV